MPFARRLVVLGVHDLVPELDVASDLVLVDDIFEMCLDLVAGGVERAPVALRGKPGMVRADSGTPVEVYTLSSNEYWYYVEQ